MNGGVTATVRAERWCGEAAGRAIERSDRDGAKDVAIAAAIADQFALAQDENDAIEIRITF